MKTFKLIALIAGMAIITVNVSAQSSGDSQDPHKIAQEQTDHIKQTVTGVTSAQESQILTVEEDYTKNVQNLLIAYKDDKATLHAKLAPMRTDRDAKIKNILSADQFTQYENSIPEYHSGVPKKQ